jgi:hypothetical protein
MGLMSVSKIYALSTARLKTQNRMAIPVVTGLVVGHRETVKHFCEVAEAMNSPVIFKLGDCGLFDDEPTRGFGEKHHLDKSGVAIFEKMLESAGSFTTPIGFSIHSFKEGGLLGLGAGFSSMVVEENLYLYDQARWLDNFIFNLVGNGKYPEQNFVARAHEAHGAIEFLLGRPDYGRCYRPTDPTCVERLIKATGLDSLGIAVMKETEPQREAIEASWELDLDRLTAIITARDQFKRTFPLVILDNLRSQTMVRQATAAGVNGIHVSAYLVTDSITPDANRLSYSFADFIRACNSNGK